MPIENPERELPIGEKTWLGAKCTTYIHDEIYIAMKKKNCTFFPERQKDFCIFWPCKIWKKNPYRAVFYRVWCEKGQITYNVQEREMSPALNEKRKIWKFHESY